MSLTALTALAVPTALVSLINLTLLKKLRDCIHYDFESITTLFSSLHLSVHD